MTPSSKTQKQQITDLIELNDELENYFRNTIIPQLFVDANLILRKFTPPAMKQFEFSPEDLGKPFEDLVDNIRYSVIVDDVKEVIETGEILEKEIQTMDFRWFQMNIIPYLLEKQNRTNGVIITFVDITDRIRTLKELERLNASHETFIYTVSHDLKAPLANIEGLVKYLLESTAHLLGANQHNSEQKAIAQLLNISVETMRNIISDLSEITRIESQYADQAERVKFETIIDEVRLILNEKIVSNHVKIHLDLQETEIQFPRRSLRSIVFNLLSNALKYRSPERNPEIQVKSLKADGYIQFSVKDNGLGIAKDNIDMLFKPYSRIEKKVEGTGIGLYLVKRIIENEGGKIEVESEPGEGTVFKVFLEIPE